MAPRPPPRLVAVLLLAAGALPFVLLSAGATCTDDTDESGAGQEKWEGVSFDVEVLDGISTTFSSPLKVSPDGASVYVGTQDGRLVAFNAATGVKRWATGL